MSSPIVSYLRVSTAKQGASGLGLDAQRAAIAAFCAAEGLAIVAEVVEVESGKGADALATRPELRRALDIAKRHKAPVVVAKLDRLSRDVAFISGLMAHNVPFFVSELGRDVKPFMLHIYAAIAQQERDLISRRTRDALQAKAARGEVVGNVANLDAHRAEATAANRAAADRAAANVLPIIDAIRATGATTLQAIADALTARGVATPRGGAWTATAVRRALARA